MFVFLTNDLNLFITLSLTIKQVKLERSNVLINKFIYRRLNVCMCVLDCKFFCNKINNNFSIFLYLNVRQNLWNNILLIIIMLIVKEIGFMKLTFHLFSYFLLYKFHGVLHNRIHWQVSKKIGPNLNINVNSKRETIHKLFLNFP